MVVTEDTSVETEEQKVDRWRHESFAELLPGFSAEIVDLLATNLEVSPHDLEYLLEKGCDPELAVKILI